MIIGFYGLFALTTAIVALYELIYPVMRRRAHETGKSVENKFMIYFTAFCINLLIAPFIFLSCVVPSYGKRFRDSLYDGMFPTDA